ncbi:MAG: anhydro-N-acetylmuramic acid kinase [Nitrospirae bacterium]|nr:anhydro-N-acetylmuramic acid kinase [Nitrospirota bacterium]MCL5285309.1 anhydro-N-acetylmuramic acid kinase [Nitrospirota bacterium]
MCGTSLDGIDGSLISVEHGKIRLLAFEESPFDASFRQDMKRWIAARDPLPDPSRFMPDLATLLSRTEIRLGERLLRKAGITHGAVNVVGTHGVTLRHHPDPHRLDFLSGSPTADGVSYQFSDPFSLARAFGVPVVSQFRGADVAAGGSGAPLAPILHRAVFSASEDRAFLNLGGIANITFLPASSSESPVIAFDTGPGNMLLDLTILALTSNREHVDIDGRRARAGTVIRPLLEALAADPYFCRTPPKSTGREEWGEGRLSEVMNRLQSQGIDPSGRTDDILATLAELTAWGIRRALAFLPSPPKLMIAGGGGVRNRFLMERIAALTEMPVRDSGNFGLPSQAIESVAFAYLALLTLSGRPGSIRTVTGASQEVVLGQITPPPGGLSPEALRDVRSLAGIHLPSPDRPRRPG